MPINRYRFYVGPLGSVQALPPLPKGATPSSTPIMFGGLHQGLSGRVTLDVFAYRRTWNLPWKYLLRSDRIYLNALYRGIVPGPYRMVDPRHFNMCPADVSAGGSQTGGSAGFTASAGTLSFLAPTIVTMHPDIVSLIRGGQVWSPAAAGNTLLGNHQGSPVGAIPVLSGSFYSYSAYVAATAGSHQLLIQPYDVTGAALTAVLGAATALTSTMVRLSIDNWVPPANAVSFAVGLKAGGANTITTTGWQVECDQPHSPWGVGVGCPQVLIPSLTESYPYLKYTTTTMIIQEV